MELLLDACLRLAAWAQGKIAPGRPSNGGLGVLLFFCVLVGVPMLAVAWGYVTGRLPAPSPYSD